MNEVTAYITSKDRYWTTLPSAILSIIFQTIKPKRFILFMDGEHHDLRENDVYSGLFRMLDLNGITWEVVLTPQIGSVRNHNNAIEMAKTEWLWRVDDDNFAEPTALENMLACDGPKVGAIAGLVIDPRYAQMCPPDIDTSLRGVNNNVQWFLHDTKETIETEHLYSSFIFKREVGKGCCCLDLSPVGHREETIFSHEIFRKGWKLLVTPKAITWHVRQSNNGIRSYSTRPEMWDFDSKIFQFKLKQWGYKEPKLVVLNNGKGDHVMFKMVWPKIKEQWKGEEIVLGVCYPEVFEDEKEAKLVSIAEAADLCSYLGKNMDDFNIYKFCIDRQWKEHLSLAFLRMYSK